jgi:RHS repeat-associated protein
VSGHRTCGESRPKTHTATENLKRCYHRNQQYSIVALTNGGGSITERYAYDAYGTPTITDAAGTTLTTSVDNNRYTYTGREFDEALGLYHYRARMYDSVAGRFCSRDPIGFMGSRWNQYEYTQARPLIGLDPYGLKCTISILMGHSWEVNNHLNNEPGKFSKCDRMGAICCNNYHQHRTCKEKNGDDSTVVGSFPLVGDLYCKDVPKMVKGAKKPIDITAGEICDGPCGCKKVTVSYKCGPKMKACVKWLVSKGELDSNPCGSSSTVECGK